MENVACLTDVFCDSCSPEAESVSTAVYPRIRPFLEVAGRLFHRIMIVVELVASHLTLGGVLEGAEGRRAVTN